MRSTLTAVLLVAPLVACAKREKLSVTSPTVATVSTGVDGEKIPPFLDPTADPLCGEHWKWDGVRCLKMDGTEDPTAPGARAARFESEEGGGEAPRPRRPQPPAESEAVNAKLAIEDVKVGEGAEARRGDLVRIHYVGTLTDGKEFDSSRRRNESFEFRLGSGMTIKGFDAAVTGMKVGGVRKVTIPPELGYGRRGAPPSIPPSATLRFELELLEVISRSGGSDPE